MKLWTHSYPAHPKNGDVYLVETSTYLVSAAGDRLTSRRTVPFSALDSVPLVLFCRPNSWRDRLDQLSSEHGISLNVAVEADSLSLQTHIVANGGVYALLGPAPSPSPWPLASVDNHSSWSSVRQAARYRRLSRHAGARLLAYRSSEF